MDGPSKIMSINWTPKDDHWRNLINFHISSIARPGAGEEQKEGSCA